MALSSINLVYASIRPPPPSIHFLKARSPQSRTSRYFKAVTAASGKDDASKENEELRKRVQEAIRECVDYTNGCVPYTPEEFMSIFSEGGWLTKPPKPGSKVKGKVFATEAKGAFVELRGRSAYIPVQEVCLYDIKYPWEAGIIVGYEDEFLVTDKKQPNGYLTVSLRPLQDSIAWERCKQLQTEGAIVNGKVVNANRGGAITLVEGITGFVPFSQISATMAAEELLDKELPLKFMEVDEEKGRLILSNRKAMSLNRKRLDMGTVVTGTVQNVKPYGAFLDIDGINGLLHVSQISHNRVSDIQSLLHPGDTLKVMVLSHDHERGRVSLSTKKLEPTPGDMIHNPRLVFEKAEEMAEAFRRRIAQAEAMVRSDILSFGNKDNPTAYEGGILGGANVDLRGHNMDLKNPMLNPSQ